MKTEIEFIDAKKAESYLALSRGNRVSGLRKENLRRLVRDILAGEFYLTHEGIAFDDQGALVDGHHRLTAIVQAKTHSVQMMVTRGVPAKARPKMNIAKAWTVSDLLRISKRKAAVANVLARLFLPDAEGSVTPDPIWTTKVLSYFGEEIDAVDGMTAKESKGCSATVRAAAVLRLVENPKIGQHIADVLHSVTYWDFNNAKPIVNAYLRQVASGKVQAGERPALFARAWSLFDINKQYLTAITIKNPERNLEQARDVFLNRLTDPARNPK